MASHFHFIFKTRLYLRKRQAFPYPENVALASHLESIIRVGGVTPATIGILNGVARIGLQPEELIELAASAGKPETRKVSRRDLAYVCGLVLLKNFANCLLGQ